MKKILIVEDEPSYQDLLHKELTTKGYTVINAKDGKEGYEYTFKETENNTYY